MRRQTQINFIKLPSWEKPEFKTKSILTQSFHFQEVSYTNVQEYRSKDGHYSSLQQWKTGDDLNINKVKVKDILVPHPIKKSEIELYISMWKDLQLTAEYTKQAT